MNKSEKQIKAKLGMLTAFYVIILILLLGNLSQHIFQRIMGIAHGQHIPGDLVVVALVVLLLTVIIGQHTSLRRYLCSNQVSIPAITSVTMLSILGTLILQNQSETAMQQSYGPVLPYLRVFFLYDIFHSFAFCALIGFTAGALLLVISRKKKITMRYLGALSTHSGILIVLAGIAIGQIWTVKGRLDLHVGETSEHFTLTNSSMPTQEKALGFTVRLDKFELKHYKPEYRLRLYQIDANQEKQIFSIDPFEQDNAQLLKRDIRLLNYWPDYTRDVLVTPLSSGTMPTHDSNTIATLSIAKKESPHNTRWLFDHTATIRDSESDRYSDQENTRVWDDAGYTWVFFWYKKAAKAYIQEWENSATLSSHEVIFGEQSLHVNIGQTYAFSQFSHKIKILRSFNDFVIDMENHTPYNRSSQPNNPAYCQFTNAQTCLPTTSDTAYVCQSSLDIGQNCNFDKMCQTNKCHLLDPQGNQKICGYEQMCIRYNAALLHIVFLFGGVWIVVRRRKKYKT